MRRVRTKLSRQVAGSIVWVVTRSKRDCDKEAHLLGAYQTRSRDLHVIVKRWSSNLDQGWVLATVLFVSSTSAVVLMTPRWTPYL